MLARRTDSLRRFSEASHQGPPIVAKPLRQQRKLVIDRRQLPPVDPLTQAHSLSYFAQQMPREFQRARRRQQALSVVSCRIEEFEPLARQYGYHVAEEAVRAFADDVHQHLRGRQGWFARVGEDRFIVVLPGIRFSGAKRLARKLLRRYTEVPVMTKAGSIPCTVKIDITACEPRDESTSLAS